MKKQNNWALGHINRWALANKKKASGIAPTGWAQSLLPAHFNFN